MKASLGPLLGSAIMLGVKDVDRAKKRPWVARSTKTPGFSSGAAWVRDHRCWCSTNGRQRHRTPVPRGVPGLRGVSFQHHRLKGRG